MNDIQIINSQKTLSNREKDERKKRVTKHIYIKNNIFQYCSQKARQTWKL